jgi:hypothetical protein
LTIDHEFKDLTFTRAQDSTVLIKLVSIRDELVLPITNSWRDHFIAPLPAAA